MHHSPGHLTAGQVMEMVSSCWCVMVEMSGENVYYEIYLWLSTEAVAFSPRPHPYLPCFAPLSRERLSLHCSPN